MAKHKHDIELVNLSELPETIQSKFQKLDKVYDCPKIQHLCELSPTKIRQIDHVIKKKTIYFDYEYVLNSLDHQLQQEKLIDMNIDFSKHAYINEKMYTILLNWLCEVHVKFKTAPETLYLTHQVISRYLTLEYDIRRSHLQLVGLASFYMCSKYEDEYPPEIKDMVYICDKAFTQQDIIDMEWKILSKFNFNLLFVPTTYAFISMFSFFGQFDKQVLTCIMYLCNISVLHTSFLQYKLSEIVASAMAISRTYYNCDDDKIFPEELVYCSCYILDDLKKCIKTFNDFFANSKNFSQETNSVYKRYSGAKFNCVAIEFEKFDWKRLM